MGCGAGVCRTPHTRDPLHPIVLDPFILHKELSKRYPGCQAVF